MIPKNGWKPMEDAPKDGTVIMVVHHLYNQCSQPKQVQAAHWFCNEKGTDWGWKRPWCSGWVAYADAWMTFEEFKAAQAAEAQPEFRLPDPAVPEFDL